MIGRKIPYEVTLCILQRIVLYQDSLSPLLQVSVIYSGNITGFLFLLPSYVVVSIKLWPSFYVALDQIIWINLIFSVLIRDLLNKNTTSYWIIYYHAWYFVQPNSNSNMYVILTICKTIGVYNIYLFEWFQRISPIVSKSKAVAYRQQALNWLKLYGISQCGTWEPIEAYMWIRRCT